LVVGDQAAIDSADWALFRTTGIAHLVAISGVHVTMFAWLAAAVLGRVWRRLPALAQAWPTPLAARLGGVLLASGYAWLAGWGVPAQRTVLMLLMAAVLRTGQARWPWPLVLLAAGVVVTTLDPWALLQPGFWLSFAAVGLLMASEPAQGGPVGASNDPQAQARGSRAAVRVAGLRALLAEHGRAQWVATLGLAPLGLVFFQQVSVVGLLANLVAIPWVTLVVTPLALLGTLAPALWAVAAWGVGVLVACLQGLADGAWAVWRVPVAPDWALWPAALGTVLGVLPLPWRLRALALPLVVPLLWPWPVRPADGQFELLAVDVGQGTAVLVRTRHHLLVYDAGPGYHAGGDAGDRILTPLLRARGEARIDTLVVSHRDTDHAGGAHSLLATWPVEQLLSGLPTHHRLHAEAAHWRFCHEGQRWQWDGVDFEVLHPPAPASPEVAPALLAPSSNAASCVLRVVDAHGRVALLTGDIEAAQEHRLVHERPEAVRADIVLVPHHGSRTSSTPGFVMAVSARWAVVQAGYRSRYGHPAADVEARWQRWGAEVVRTDRCGAWRWHNKRVSCLRQAHQRHWRQ
jgi:competence protein ComEC